MIVLAGALAGTLAGHYVDAAQVSLSGAWFRALPAGLPAGGYFVLHNHGAAVKLVGASSTACGMLMLHKSEVSSGMAGMTMAEDVDVPAGGTLAFAPGGYHLMCTSPGPAMAPGSHVPVVLKFSDGSSTTAAFAVKGANGK